LSSVSLGDPMFNNEVFANVILMVLCYVYILFIIFVLGKMDKLFHISPKASRKFLHAMIGNLPFIIPFFTSNIYPVLVAAPFILVTFLASSYSPFKNFNERLKVLADITEEGHQLGLVFLRCLIYFFSPVFRLQTICHCCWHFAHGLRRQCSFLNGRDIWPKKIQAFCRKKFGRLTNNVFCQPIQSYN